MMEPDTGERSKAMALVQEFGYAVYGVPDLDLSVEFFRTVCQLEVSISIPVIVSSVVDSPRPVSKGHSAC